MEYTKALARFIAETRYEDLPESVLEKARTYVLDNLASALVGSRQPWCQMVLEMVKEACSKGECTVIGQGWKAAPSLAALANGATIGGFETDHFYLEGSAHPSGTAFPAALAVGEKLGCTGRDLLTAMVVGYEALCRIGYAATRAVEDIRGFHGPGANGPFGAAAAAARILGLSPEGVTNALGIAGSQGAGLLEFVAEGAMTKRLHLGRAAQTGLESALLAARGFTGPSTVLEGAHGFFRVYSGQALPERLLDGLGKTFLMEGIRIKSYACHGTFQAVIEALAHFKASHPLEPAAIRRVHVAAPRRVAERHGNPVPTTVMGTQYSLPFSVAIALCKDPEEPMSFGEESLWDPEVRALAGRVELEAKEEPGFRVRMETRSGAIDIEATTFKGAPDRPFTFADASEKFYRYAEPVIGRETAQGVVTAVKQLERLPSIRELTELLRH